MSNENDLQKLIIDGIQDKKGHKISVIDLSEIETSVSDKFIICQGNSTTQVGAIADNIREHLQKVAGIKPFNYDGYQQCEWVIIDYGPVMVHVFIPEIRHRYNLEDLWSDAPITEIPDLD